MHKIERIHDDPYHNKFSFKWMILGFLVVLVVIIITSFSGKLNFTGDLVRDINSDEQIKVSAELTVPDLSLKGEFSHLEIQGSSKSYLVVGKQKFSLANTRNNFLSFDNFDGEISFNDYNISVLKGKASKILVNGVPIIPDSGDTIEINLEESFNHNILKISDGVYIDRLIYLSRGSINLGDSKNIIGVLGEEVFIEDYQGSLEIERDKLLLEGFLSKLEVSGKQKVSIRA